MITRRNFKEDFKRNIAVEIIYKNIPIADISKRENISSTTLREWRKKYLNETVTFEQAELISLRKGIKNMESVISEQALQIHILKKTQKIVQQMNKKGK